MQAFRCQRVRDAEHQRHIRAGADRVPDRLDLARQVVTQRADQVEFRASAAGGAQPGQRDVLAGAAAADIVVLQRHAAKGEHEGAVCHQLVPANIVAGDGLLRTDDVGQNHRSGARTVTADRADIPAGHVEEPVQLARRVMEPPGARPAIGAAIDGARSKGRINPSQFRRDEVECLRPVNRHISFTAAPPIGPGTALEPAAPDHRPGDPRAVRHRSGNVAEKRRGIGVARMRHDLDAAVADQHREGAPMGAVRDRLGRGERGRLVHRQLR